jgi:hypothetical protein
VHLIGLAQRLVELDREATEVRSQMLKALINGAGGDPELPNPPTQPAAAPAKTKRLRAGKPTAEPKASRAHKAKAATAAKPQQDEAEAKPSGYAERMRLARIADDEMLALLRTQPGARTGELRRATGQKSSTLGERLKRLARQGPIERTGEGWAATAPG